MRDRQYEECEAVAAAIRHPDEGVEDFDEDMTELTSLPRSSTRRSSRPGCSRASATTTACCYRPTSWRSRATFATGDLLYARVVSDARRPVFVGRVSRLPASASDEAARLVVENADACARTRWISELEFPETLTPEEEPFQFHTAIWAVADVALKARRRLATHLEDYRGMLVYRVPSEHGLGTRGGIHVDGCEIRGEAACATAIDVLRDLVAEVVPEAQASCTNPQRLRDARSV